MWGFLCIIFTYIFYMKIFEKDLRFCYSEGIIGVMMTFRSSALTIPSTEEIAQSVDIFGI